MYSKGNEMFFCPLALGKGRGPMQPGNGTLKFIARHS